MVRVEVVMPTTLTLLPQDGALVGGIIVYAVVGSADGRTSDIVRRQLGMKIPPNTEAAVRAKPTTYSTAIRVKGGESTLSIAVTDQIGGTMGFARAAIIAK